MTPTANQFRRPATPARILIVEEALRSPKGHWPEYIRTIATACRNAGDEVTILAHSDASPDIVSQLQAIPLLPHSAWDGIYNSRNPLVRYSGAILHNRRLYRRLSDFLEQSEKFDCVLAPTILIHHLFAWGRLARRFAGRKFDRLTLLFVNGQGIYQGPGKPVLFPRHPKRSVFRSGLRAFRPMVNDGTVVLGAETAAMAREYQAFSGIRFQRFPHPVDFSMPDEDESSVDEPVFACLGFARHEKGSDLLQDAILAVRRERPDLRIRFVLQWLDDFRDESGNLVTRHPDLVADPAVEFITEAISTGRYLRELRRTAAMILPYRASSYYGRVSRVAIEAAMAGIPLLYTRHTWLEEMVKECGAGVGFEDENRADLVSKIIFFAEHIRALKLRARERRQQARATYSPGAFRDSLLGTAVAAPDPRKPLRRLRSAFLRPTF